MRFSFNWTNTTFIQLGVLVCIILLGTSFWILHIIKDGIREDVRVQLQTIQHATRETMHYWRNSNLEAAIRIANRRTIKQYIARLIKSKPDPASLHKKQVLSSLRKELQPFIKQHHYQGFFVVSPKQINYGSMHDSNLGRQNLLVTQDPQSLLQAFAGETVISEPVRSDVPLHDDNGILQINPYTMLIVTPVTDQQDKVIALLMFRIPPTEHFRRILSIGRFGDSGETYIINKHGMLLSPSRFEIPLMHAGLIKPDTSSAYQLILRTPRGNITRRYRPTEHYPQQPLTHIVENTLQDKSHLDLEPVPDYRGVMVVNTGTWDARTGLGFITQMDYDEAYTMYRTTRNGILTVSGIAAVLLVSLIASLMNSRQHALQLVKKRSTQLKHQNQSLLDEIDDRKRVEQELQNSQQRTNAILQSAFDAIIASDEYGVIELTNPATSTMFGYSEEELVGQNINILMPESISEKHNQLISEHNRGQTSTIIGQRREMVAKRKDGSTFPIELTVEETLIGREKYFTSTITDITERKAMLERISASEKDYRTIINNLNDTFYRTDTAGRIVMASPSAEHLLGYKPEEVLGLQASALFIDPRSGEEFIRAIRQNNGSITDYEAQLRRKDGRVIWVSTNAHFYTDIYDHALGVEGTTRDITARKQAEEELRESRQRLAFHIKQTPLGVIEWDVDFKVIEWNPAAEQVFGYSRNEAIGRHAAELIIPEVIKPYVDDIWHSLLGNPNGQHSTNQNINKQGETIWCEWYNTPLVDENLQVIGVASMVMDVTPRKKAEEILARDHEQLQALVEERTAELNIAKDEAERANEAKSAFLANMSHELRTPIHTILSFAEMGMKKGDKLDKQKLAQYFRNIHQGGERQLHLLNDLLDLAKLETHTTTYEFSEHDIGHVIEEQIAQHELLLQKKQLRVVVHPTPVGTRLTFDRVRIEQVIRNLLSNAIKFSQPGKTINIELALGEIHTERNTLPALTTIISDEGIGIPEDELESIFDKFVQSSKTRTGAGGTGLGLAICQEIITAHGGEISARNNPRGGASFYFTLPILHADKKHSNTGSKSR